MHAQLQKHLEQLLSELQKDTEALCQYYKGISWHLQGKGCRLTATGPLSHSTNAVLPSTTSFKELLRCCPSTVK